jgi:hypothetical protein
MGMVGKFGGLTRFVVAKLIGNCSTKTGCRVSKESTTARFQLEKCVASGFAL